MHIYSVGATGRNGLLVVKEALARGHTVTALVRDPVALAPQPGLTIIQAKDANSSKQGSPTNVHDHGKALANPQPPSVVIFTLANRRNVDRNAPLDLLTVSMTALLRAISRTPAPRPKLVVNSAQGAHDSVTSLPWVFSAFFQHSSMNYVINDHEHVDELVRQSGLTFVFARPCRLVDGPGEKVEVFPDNGEGIAWMPSISRQSVAEWLLDAAERPDWDGKAPVLSN
ncbi:hypothetical protein HJFPF1_06650 [Paramyrothecium foliicola]|nr:hypothetical protein HJFPF1_06650 [Paramyrothecium foliicola]